MGDLFPGDQFTSLGQHNPRQQQQQDHQQMSLNQMQISDLALARGNLNMQKELKNEKLNNSGVLSNRQVRYPNGPKLSNRQTVRYSIKVRYSGYQSRTISVTQLVT